MNKTYYVSPHQAGALYQAAGSSTAYRIIELIDGETGDKVAIKVETTPCRVDAAFAYVMEKLGM